MGDYMKKIYSAKCFNSVLIIEALQSNFVELNKYKINAGKYDLFTSTNQGISTCKKLYQICLIGKGSISIFLCVLLCAQVVCTARRIDAFRAKGRIK